MKIIVLDGYGLNPGDLSWSGMEALGELTVYDRTSPSELLARSEGAEVLITNKTLITADGMAALPQLKYIGVLATGYNVVDIEAAKARGIIVTNIPAYSTNSVAQMVFAHILNITLPGIRSETMLHYLSSKGVYVSSGSACSSHSNKLSSALKSFGLTDGEADSSIRVSLCPENTKEEADVFISALAEGIKSLQRK